MSQQARNNPDLPPMHSIYPDRPRKYATDPQNKPSMSPANAAQGHSATPLTDTTQRIRFEGCEVCAVAPEDLEQLERETARLRASNAHLVAALEFVLARLETERAFNARAEIGPSFVDEIRNARAALEHAKKGTQ